MLPRRYHYTHDYTAYVSVMLVIAAFDTFHAATLYFTPLICLRRLMPPAAMLPYCRAIRLMPAVSPCYALTRGSWRLCFDTRERARHAARCCCLMLMLMLPLMSFAPLPLYA